MSENYNLSDNLSEEGLELLKNTIGERLIAHFSLEERLVGLTPEQRIAGLSPEDLIKYLSTQTHSHQLTDEERRQLQQLLESQDN